MQEKRGGCGGAPRNQAPQDARKLRARQQQSDRTMAGRLASHRKQSPSVAATSTTAPGKGFGAAQGKGFGGRTPTWRHLGPEGGAATVDVSHVESLLVLRHALLIARDFDAADELRQRLSGLGVALRDEEMTWWVVEEELEP